MGVLRIFALAACGQSATSENQEEIQSAVQKTDEQSEAPQNGAVAEQLETGKQPDTEMETGLSESVSTEEQEADVDMTMMKRINNTWYWELNKIRQ